MSFDIIIPEVDSKPKNTKDGIITILTYQWPLTLREIYYQLKKQFNYSATYQSVYKAVKELISSNVLKDNNKKYFLNIDWVKKVQSFTDIIETNYYTKQKLHNISGIKDSKIGDDLMILTFEKIFDMEKYLYYFMKNKLFGCKNEIICQKIIHEWKPLYYLRAEYNYYQRLKEKGHKIYFLCNGNSKSEDVSKKFYRSLGINVKTVANMFAHEVIVFLDYYVQIFVLEDLLLNMKKCLEKDDKLRLLREVLDKKSLIKVVINKDKDLADKIKKEIVEMF